MARPSLLGYFSAHVSALPFASSDPDLEWDTDFTDSVATLAQGWVNKGSGGTFTADGYVPGTAGYLEIDSVAALQAASAAIYQAGALLIAVDREAVSYDDGLDGTNFSDSVGQETPATRYLLQALANPYAGEMFRIIFNADGSLSFIDTVATTSTTEAIPRINSRRSTNNDSDHMTLMMSWDLNFMYLYIDGVYYARTARTAGVEAEMFENISVGSDYTGAGSFLGDYAISRLQLVSRTIYPRQLQTRIGLCGDSFVVAGTQRAEPTGYTDPTVANVNAVQFEGNFAGTSRRDRIEQVRGQNNWWHCIERWFFRTYGAIPSQAFNAGGSGAGWRSNVNQFAAGYRNALIAYNPEIIVCLGSVNDITTSVPVVSATVLADAQALLDEYIDGCSNLRKILFFDGFYGNNVLPNPPANDSVSEWQSYISALSGLNGYRDIVEFVSVWDDWGGSSVSPYYIIGASPDNATSGGPAGTGSDVHPTATGHIRMAELMYPKISALLASRPAAARV